MTASCPHCGAALARGAVACFRCGKLVADAATDASTGGASRDPTSLGTSARASLVGGTWRLLGKLGQGATGEVWAARDVKLDREVALKLMHPKGDAAVFEAAVRGLAAVEHPNVGKVLAVGRHGELPFFVSPRFSGMTVAELQHQKGGSLPLVELEPLVRQVCEGLEALHARGVVHGALKPSNVYVALDGRVTLLDAGFARATVADDVRAVGVLAYEWATGRAPEAGARLEPGLLPEAATQAVWRALHTDAGDRWPSVAAFRVAWGLGEAPLPPPAPERTVVGPAPVSTAETVIRMNPVLDAPTEPLRRSPAASRAALALLGGTGLLSAALIGLGSLLKTPPPPAPQPIPALPLPVSEPETAVSTRKEDLVAANAPVTVTIDPSEQTWKPIDYHRFREYRPGASQLRTRTETFGTTRVHVRTWATEQSVRKEVPAEVEIDATWRGRAPLELDLPPGSHLFRLTYGAHPASAFTTTLQLRTRTSLDIELPPAGLENRLEGDRVEPLPR